jgi:hypothetical protein
LKAEKGAQVEEHHQLHADIPESVTSALVSIEPLSIRLVDL